ncbi:hypothetical protein LCGC14_0600290 [marine sediment metagenome]|uniref:Uncharacterized protein n=1 Tax=marine sediment metagenome TaxID=412755 RepID=A0A0F9RUP9_9ZZZZ|nr:hypothetical protein [Methylophaga sp.]HEC58340.1 hypothetical protein [Methylophaga sp.]
MLITTKKMTISLLTSAALSAGLAISPMTASAEANPFATVESSTVYLQLAEAEVEKSATEHQDSVMEDENDVIESDEMSPDHDVTGEVEDSATEHQESVTED